MAFSSLRVLEIEGRRRRRWPKGLERRGKGGRVNLPIFGSGPLVGRKSGQVAESPIEHLYVHSKNAGPVFLNLQHFASVFFSNLAENGGEKTSRRFL